MLLDFVAARNGTYSPTYHCVLENKRAKLVEELQALAASKTDVLLDFETNTMFQSRCRMRA